LRPLIRALLAREDRLDKLLPAQQPVAVDRELGGDRVKIRERALLKRVSVKHRHGG
jgi:hypothetical protein